LKVYIDTDKDVSLSWKVMKLMKEPDFDITEVLDKYENIEKPSFEKNIEPTKKFADIIIPNFGFTSELSDVNNLLLSNPAIQMLMHEVKWNLDTWMSKKI